MCGRRWRSAAALHRNKKLLRVAESRPGDRAELKLRRYWGGALFRRLFVVVLSLGLAFAAFACSDDSDADPTATVPGGQSAAQTVAPTTAALSGGLTVFAAASLRDAFTEVEKSFEAANPGVDVTYHFAGSPALRTQLMEGAKADIYAPADTNNMQQALEANLVADAGETFTHNRLAVIMPKDNPANITALQDLGNDGVKLVLVLALAEVPVGTYARRSLTKMDADGSFGEGFSARVLANMVSEEPNVKAVVTKVQLGEADAGIVYVTDVTAGVAPDVKVIEIPDGFNVIATYPIALTAAPANPDAAEAFIDFVLSADGQAILARFGFQPIE